MKYSELLIAPQLKQELTEVGRRSNFVTEEELIKYLSTVDDILASWKPYSTGYVDKTNVKYGYEEIIVWDNFRALFEVAEVRLTTHEDSAVIITFEPSDDTLSVDKFNQISARIRGAVANTNVMSVKEINPQSKPLSEVQDRVLSLSGLLPVTYGDGLPLISKFEVWKPDTGGVHKNVALRKFYNSFIQNK